MAEISVNLSQLDSKDKKGVTTLDLNGEDPVADPKIVNIVDDIDGYDIIEISKFGKDDNAADLFVFDLS